MGWDNLPQEVLLKILQEVESTYPPEVLQCQLTCRAWKQISQVLFYSSLNLHTFTDAQKALSTVTAYNLNHAVKKVSFEGLLVQSPKMEQFFPLFFGTCPYVTSIESDYTRDESLWTKLLRECYKGTLTKVETLPVTDLNRDSGIKIYGYVAMELCSTLSIVQIWDWPKSDPSFQNNQVALNLHKFPRLKRLTAYVCGVYNASKVAPLIQECKQLEYLSIINHPDRRVFYSHAGFDQYVPPPAPMTGIKTIETDMVTMTPNMIDQLIYVFPNLTKLTLNPTTESDFSLENDLDEEISFMARMQLEGYRIPRDIWPKFISHVYNNVSTFELSALFPIDMNQVVLISMQNQQFKDQGGLLRIVYVRRNNFLEIEPYVGISSAENLIKIVYETRDRYDARNIDEPARLPHMDLVESVGNKFKRLHVSISPAVHFGDENGLLYSLASGYFLDHVLEYCTELTELTISSAHIVDCNPDYAVSNSVTTLRLIECLVCPSVLLQLSQRLPRLTDFVFCYSCFVSMAGQVLQTNKSISIDLSYTTLNSLSLEFLNRIYGDCTEFHLKINRLNEIVYYTGKVSKEFNKCTKLAYQESLDYNSSVSIEINCVDLKSMFLETTHFGIDIQFKDSNDFQFKFDD
ncbi:hypothetical protein MFLAVUS_007633 [Mucor flavus]|uniref:F-box domain-containing protein n=1 Tax=Mucor flavus TaxID=439312 RepID=A0ABP9Z4U5_9FUNG